MSGRRDAEGGRAERDTAFRIPPPPLQPFSLQASLGTAHLLQHLGLAGAQIPHSASLPVPVPLLHSLTLECAVVVLH